MWERHGVPHLFVNTTPLGTASSYNNSRPLKISAGCGLCGFIEDYGNDSFFEDHDNACLKKLTALKICRWPAV